MLKDQDSSLKKGHMIQGKITKHVVININKKTKLFQQESNQPPTRDNIFIFRQSLKSPQHQDI